MQKQMDSSNQPGNSPIAATIESSGPYEVIHHSHKTNSIHPYERPVTY